MKGVRYDALHLTPTGVLFAGRRFPCVIGRGGIRDAKREGDGATPSGRHRILGLLYRPDRLPARALPRWAVPISPRDLWCDDPDHPAYNHPVRAPLKASHEHLHRADPMYDLILVTDWNYPKASPGKGSAIFVHTWRRPGHPTAGCLAFSRENLLWIAARVKIGTEIVVPPALGIFDP